MAVNDGNDIILGVIAESGADLTKLKEDIAKSVQSLNTLNEGFDLTRGKVKQLVLEAESFQRLFGESGSFNRIVGLLSAGGTNTALRNAQVQGNVSRAQSTDVAAQARELNGIFKTLFDTIKAQANRTILELAAQRQVPASQDIEALKEQVKASQLRSGVFSQQANNAAQKGNLEEAERLEALVKQEQEDQALLNQTIADTIRLQKENLRTKNDLLAINEKIRLQEAEIAAAQQAGRSAPDIRALELDLQRLNVKRTILNEDNEEAGALQKQLLLTQQMVVANEKLAIQEKEKLKADQQALAAAQKAAAAQQKLNQQQNEPQTVGNTRRSPSALFAIQADLLVNYALMNQIFKLFSFGSQYVVELDKNFRDLQATIGATDTEMVGLKDTILTASQGTRFSAVEVAKASVTLAQAGLSVKQIKESLSSILTFATATGSDLATSVDTASSAMNVFEIRADEMAHTVNVMTAAINDSKLDVQKLATGIQYAGTLAAESGAQFEEFIAVLGAAANAGIRSGSTIGTGLRQILNSFLEPSKKMLENLTRLGISVNSLDVKAYGLIGVFRNLKEAGFTTADAFQSMNIRAAAMFGSISNNLDLAEKLEQKFLLTSAATEANATQMKSLANTSDQFANTLGLVINQGLGPLRDLLQQVLKASNDLLNSFLQYPKWIQTIIESVTALGTALLGLRVIATFIPGAARFFGPWGIAIAAAVSAATVAYAYFGKTSDDVAEKTDNLKGKLSEAQGAFDETKDKINSINDAIKNLNDRYPSLSQNQEGLRTEALRLEQKFGELGLRFDNTKLSVHALVEALQQLRGEMNNIANGQATEVIKQQLLLLQQTAILFRQNSKFTLPSSITESGDTFVAAKSYLNQNPATSSVGTGILKDLVPFLKTLTDQLHSIGPDDKAGQDKLLQQIADTRQQIYDYKKKLLNELFEVSKATGVQRPGVPVTVEVEKKLLNYMVDYLNNVLGSANDAGSQITGLQAATIQKKAAEVGNNLIITQIEASVEEAAKNLKASQLKLENGDKTLTPKEKSDLETQIKDLQTFLAKMTVDNLANNLKEVFTEVETKAGFSPDFIQKMFDKFKPTDETRQGFNIKLGEISNNAQQNQSEATKSATSFFDQMKAKFDSLNTAATSAMDKMINSVKHMTDATDQKIKNIDYIIRESTDKDNGALRGVFSDVDLELLKTQQKKLQAVKLQEQITQYQTELGAYNGYIGKLQPTINQLKVDPANLQQVADYSTVTKNVTDALDKRADVTQKLNDAQAELALTTGDAAAAAKAAGAVQLGYVDSLEKALQISATKSLQDTDLLLNMQRNVDQVTGDAKNAFSQFFQDITTGTKSVKEAFKSMAVSILQSLAKVVNDALAAQFWKLLLGSVGSAGGSVSGGGGFFGWIGNLFKNGGGEIPRFYAGGGDAPIGTRDSVPAMLRPGEFVLRNSAVDAIGVDNLRQINAMGNRSVQRPSQPMMQSKSVKLESNVYIVSKDEQPTLGPNDVLAVIGRDILQGGQTKKLIKQTMAGA